MNNLDVCKCEVKGCIRQAECGVQINIPTKQNSVRDIPPLTVLMGLRLCRQCAQEADAKEFLGDQLKVLVGLQAKAGLRGEPIFERAFMTCVSFHSLDWKRLTQTPRP